MGQFAKAGIQLPPGRVRHPAGGPAKPARVDEGPAGASRTPRRLIASDRCSSGSARRSRPAGWSTSRRSARSIRRPAASWRPTSRSRPASASTNLKAKLEAAGTSIDKVVWANWSLRDPTEFEIFNEEWVKLFPADGPVGQGTLMPPLQRRAGFRISIGVIAEEPELQALRRNWSRCPSEALDRAGRAVGRVRCGTLSPCNSSRRSGRTRRPRPASGSPTRSWPG